MAAAKNGAPAQSRYVAPRMNLISDERERQACPLNNLRRVFAFQSRRYAADTPQKTVCLISWRASFLCKLHSGSFWRILS